MQQSEYKQMKSGMLNLCFLAFIRELRRIQAEMCEVKTVECMKRYMVFYKLR